MKKTLPFILLSLVLAFSGCDAVKQAQQLGNLALCEFSLKTVENLNLAGVNVQQAQSLANLSLIDAGRLSAALAGGSLPLSFTLNVEARNPNKSAAGMNRLEYILLIDNIEMTRGTLNKKVNIPPNNGNTNIPMQMTIDLKKVLANKTGEALLNFGLNLAGAGNKPTRFTLKAKPTISIGGYSLDYPGYITISSKY